MFRLISVLATASAAWMCAGCAFVDVDVHPPATARVRPAAGPGRGREIIVFAPFEDQRLIKNRCGMQKNGYGMDTADVNCSEAPDRWLADALAIALTRAGYRVLRSDAAPGPSTVVVRGAVKQLFLEPKDGFFTRTVEGDFSARLVVTSASGLHAERTFYVKGTEEHIGSFESVFQAAAEDGTEKIAYAMVLALTELLDRYPDLGAPQATAPVAQRMP